MKTIKKAFIDLQEDEKNFMERNCNFKDAGSC